MKHKRLLVSIVILALFVCLLRMASTSTSNNADGGAGDSTAGLMEPSPESGAGSGGQVLSRGDSQGPQAQRSRVPLHRESFRASGGLVVHGESAGLVRLEWVSESGRLDVSAGVAEGEWSGSFSTGDYVLVRAWIGSSECEFIDEYSVSSDHASCDIELIPAEHCLLELVDAREGTPVRAALIQPSVMLSSTGGGGQRVKRVRTPAGSRTEIRMVNADSDSPFAIQYTGASVLLPVLSHRMPSACRCVEAPPSPEYS